MSRGFVLTAIVIALASQVRAQSIGTVGPSNQTVGPSNQNEASPKDLKRAEKMAQQVEKRFNPHQGKATTTWATGVSESPHHSTH
jgi:hypothetical protein